MRTPLLRAVRAAFRDLQRSRLSGDALNADVENAPFPTTFDSNTRAGRALDHRRTTLRAKCD